MTAQATGTPYAYQRRVDAADWGAVTSELDVLGCALLPRLLTEADAREFIKLYERDEAFRATVVMGRYRFGHGEYRYLANPLPEAVNELRHGLYPRLLPIARDWYDKLGRPTPWPQTLNEWLDQCHRAGQAKPTPLILKYGPGDWNALHCDLHGDLVFPLQVVINLTEPSKDHTGGEFLLVEQRPRAQSRGTSTTLPYLQGMVFTTRDRPIPTQRGWSAVPVRHGVSVLGNGTPWVFRSTTAPDGAGTKDDTLIGADRGALGLGGCRSIPQTPGFADQRRLRGALAPPSPPRETPGPPVSLPPQLDSGGECRPLKRAAPSRNSSLGQESAQSALFNMSATSTH